MIANEASPDANIIFGVAFDPELEDEMKITIIATGFEKKPSTTQSRVINRNTVRSYEEAKKTPAKTVAKTVESKSAAQNDDEDFMNLMNDLFGSK